MKLAAFRRSVPTSLLNPTHENIVPSAFYPNLAGIIAKAVLGTSTSGVLLPYENYCRLMSGCLRKIMKNSGLFWQNTSMWISCVFQEVTRRSDAAALGDYVSQDAI